ncbi:phosphate uptake regulator PhoU [Saccharolobus islandicus]|uniref:phosphate uptake regulator PhoU n=1 Tax=Saccharolobus islandicus TaxID=43080 RepID=UPI000371258F|nr:phosphate uptake regulator PhoU [Sulfolobus islandicus]
MSKSITRKIQLTGGSTYIVSLPKEWIKALSLSAGDEVEIYQDTDMKLFIVPKSANTTDQKEIKKIIYCDNVSPDAIVREFIAYYIAGFSSVSITCPRMSSSTRAYIKDIVRKRLLGAEVIEEDVSTISIQFLVDEKELSIKRAISRAFTISYNMLRDSLEAISKSDIELAKEISGRDDEVDRFFFYIARQLTISVKAINVLDSEGYNLTQTVDIYSVAKTIERVGDHANRIASLAEDVSKFSNKEDLVNLGLMILESYKSAINAFLNEKKDVAHNLISNIEIFEKLRELQEIAIKSNDNPKIITSTSMTVESLRRVARYSADIAEATIDMLAKSNR